MKAATQVGRRCAIYTRKSSEEGLEQSFNSLHAQREACEAYIKSQTHEGWHGLAQQYDDGGFSGGSMERPGLAALLRDVEGGRVDVVVVYKVDRLTRSLMDFARIVATFDRHQVSFVSVTQAFNTTTSMGRLTLNVLLSFAQFEREVTGERIRDKIAASKKKGMWMGGNLPLGYDRQDNTLVVNPAEAAQVTMIFERYLALGSVDVLQQELTAQGYRSKSRITRAGNAIGGAAFSRGALYHLLANEHYQGKILHKGEVHAGLHPAIIDDALFIAVQRQLAAQRIRRSGRSTRAATARLIGRIVSDNGKPLTPSFSYGRGGRIYRYYIAEAATDVAPTNAAADCQAPHRLPAEPLEAFIHQTLARLAGKPSADWQAVNPLLIMIEAKADGTHVVLDAKTLFGPDHPDFAMQALRTRLTAGEQALLEPRDPNRVRVRLPVPLRFRGGQSWRINVAQPGDRQSAQQNPGLIAGLKNAHAILAEQGIDPAARRVSATAQAPAQSYQRKLCLLALLAPDLQRAVLEGRVPRHVTLQGLLDRDPPPLLWRDQANWLAAQA